MKFNVWQILELLSIIIGLSRSAIKHGKIILDGPEIKEKVSNDLQKILAYVYGFTVSLFWVAVTYMGNVQGVWLGVYVCLTGILLTYALDNFENEEKRYAKRYSFWKTLAIFSVYNYVLYMGGFWKGVL